MLYLFQSILLLSIGGGTPRVLIRIDEQSTVAKTRTVDISARKKYHPWHGNYENAGRS